MQVTIVTLTATPQSPLPSFSKKDEIVKNADSNFHEMIVFSSAHLKEFDTNNKSWFLSAHGQVKGLTMHFTCNRLFVKRRKKVSRPSASETKL